MCVGGGGGPVAKKVKTEYSTELTQHALQVRHTTAGNVNVQLLQEPTWDFMRKPQGRRHRYFVVGPANGALDLEVTVQTDSLQMALQEQERQSHQRCIVETIDGVVRPSPFRMGPGLVSSACACLDRRSVGRVMWWRPGLILDPGLFLLLQQGVFHILHACKSASRG